MPTFPSNGMSGPMHSDGFSSDESECNFRNAASTRWVRHISEASSSRRRCVGTLVGREVMSEGEDVGGVYERRKDKHRRVGKHLTSRSCKGICESKNCSTQDCLLQSKGSATKHRPCHVRSSTTDCGAATASARILATRMRDRVELAKETVDNVLDALLKDISLLASSAASDESDGNLWGAQLLPRPENYLEGNRGSELNSPAFVGISHQALRHPQHQRGGVRDVQESSCGGQRFGCEPEISRLVKQDGRGGSSGDCEVEVSRRLKQACRSADRSECESEPPKWLEQDGRSHRSFDCESDAPRAVEQYARRCRSFDCESEASRWGEQDASLGVWELEQKLQQELFESRSLCAPSQTGSESGKRKSPIQSVVAKSNQTASARNEDSFQVWGQGRRSVHQSPPALKLDGLLPQDNDSAVDAEQCPDAALPGAISDCIVRHALSEPPPQSNSCSNGVGTDCEGRNQKRAFTFPLSTRQWSHEGALPMHTTDSRHSRPEGKHPDNLIPSQVWRQRFAILPLVVCGLYPRDIDHTKRPQGRRRQWHALAYQSFITVVVFACLVAYVWQPSGKGGLASAGILKSGRLSETAIALGSLTGLCSIHAITFGPSILDAVGVLRVYTEQQEGCCVWTTRSCLDTFVTLAFWAGAVLLRVCADGSVAGAIESNMDAQDFRGTLAFLIVSGTVLNLAGIILYMTRAMVLLVDGFCATSMACPGIDWQATAQAWNLIQSLLRHTCRMIQVCFVVLQVTVFATVACIAVELWNSKQTLLKTLIDVAPTFTLCAGLTRTLFFAADVTNRCDRIPALISSAQSDGIIDAGHHYFLSYLSSCAAGFYIFGARLTSEIALKFLYILSALGFAALSRLAED